MILLEDLNNTKLSYGIRDLSPLQYDTIQVKNKLLDGSYHIQAIGSPMKYYTFEILSNHNQVDLINLIESRGEPLRLIIDDKFYVGMLDSKAEWTRLILRRGDPINTLYTAKLQLNISEEGSI